MTVEAKLVQITRYPQKGSDGERLEQAELVAGMGMAGDMHQGGDRQLSLLSLEVRRWIDAQSVKGLCFARYKENLLIDGLDLAKEQPETVLYIGKATLKISVRSKRCFDECSLFSRGVRCLLAEGATFAVVERSGSIHSGDTVKLCHVPADLADQGFFPEVE